MTVIYGLTAAGFIPKPRSVILSELQDQYRSAFGADVDVSSNSSFGQEIAIAVESEGTIWDQLAALYDGAFAASSSGPNLVRNCALVGVTPLPATKSRVYVTCTGSTGTTIPAGTVFATTGIGVQVSTLADATISGTTVPVLCEAAVTGPITFAVGSITSIVTPVAGLSSVRNAATNTYTGTDLETDALLRARRDASLRISGGASSDAVRASILGTPNVTGCAVNVNRTASTVDGLPAYSMECLVSGGTDADIGAVLAAKCAATTPLYGTTAINVADSQGQSHPYYFSRPSDTPIYLQARVWVNQNAQQPANLSDLIAAATVKVFAIGQDVHSSAFSASIFGVGSYVLNVEYIRVSDSAIADPTPIDTGSPGGSTDLAISSRAVASMSATNVRIIILQKDE